VIPLLALAAALLAAGPAPRRAALPAPSVHRETLPDGLELLVLPVPGADVASLRVVVRAGSAQDPHRKGGLAHLLEHLLHRGANGPVPLVEELRAAGADVNAFTSRDATWFALDAPGAAFPAAAERLLRAVTDPRFEEWPIGVERAVVAREGDLDDGPGAFGMVEEALFLDHRAEGSILGDDEARERLRLEDLVAYYGRHYVTRGMTVVLAGAVDVAAAREVLARAFLLPPARTGEGLAAAPQRPKLPLDARLRAPFLGAVVGAVLDPEDHRACPAVAELVALRARIRLELRAPLVQALEVGCHTVRGNELLVVLAYSPTLEASDLHADLARVLEGVSRAPITPAERRLLARRRARVRELLAGDPRALADRAVVEAARTPAGVATALPFLDSDPPDADVVAAARRAADAGRRLVLFLSPFEG
jgi:hypothetical protein